MQIQKKLFYSFGVIIFISAIVDFVSGCTCSRMHPQEYFCTADFVIVADIHRFSMDKSNYTRIYKVKIRKEYKASSKAREALSHGRLLSPATESMCGLNLEPGKRYLLAGRVNNGKSWISLCNWAQEWKKLTPGQKKGIRRLYYRGCDCKVEFCQRWDGRCPNFMNHCEWQTLPINGKEDCQANHAVCYRGPTGSCQWSQPKAYKSCMKRYEKVELRQAKEEQRRRSKLDFGGSKYTKKRKDRKERKRKRKSERFELTPLVEVVRNF
ncbi:metalloproteinase inhibitor 3-like [Artemia franciscana]|uniref:NTR domain-containing protein n=1 Tax=Artemia franciscana TaxID=6661 RepID=A0AA88LF74_ARTSF|nr:hypothetical protein QYM36_001046 [Artemia franciscana]KAK2724394.1 hypothetical protein QYM36_001046 [Artemia franciscana]